MIEDTEVRQIAFLDRPNFTGLHLDSSGTLSVVAHGRGLACGPLPPQELERYGLAALEIAQRLRDEARLAQRQAALELDAIVNSAGNHHVN